MISIGLACVTVSLVLTAQSIGVTSDNGTQLLRARMQAVQLVAAQCLPAAAANDTKTMALLVRQMTASNADIISAALYDGEGKVAYAFPAETLPQWNRRTKADPGPGELRIPIISPATGKLLAEAAFEYRREMAFAERYLPRALTALLADPGVRLAVFVAVAGFACYRFYLKRMLRSLDPTSVIPPRVRTMLDALAEGVLVLDHRGVIVMANESFSRTTGLPLDRIQGNRVDQMAWVRPNGQGRPDSLPWTGMLKSGEAVVGVQLGLESGENDAESSGTGSRVRRLYMVNTAPIVSQEGKVRGGLATFDDVTEVERINLALKESTDEIQRQNVELLRLATTDPLTNCLNRRSFLEQFERHWKESATTWRPLGCIMVDVDRFKSINDRFGHAAGDTVLKEVARVLREATDAKGDDAVACRYGGEEFCILLPNTTLSAAADFAEKLRRAIDDEPWTITPVTASLGASGSEQGATDVKELLDWADRSLYHSKKTGRNRVTCWGQLPTEPIIAEADPTRSAA
ncbi:MAG TPA: diguanylate cyclase [Tepidisphaeraceae bacterium]